MRIGPFGAALVVAGLIATGCSSASSGGGTAPLTTPSVSPSGTASALPELTEAFTLLPCPSGTPETTLAMEGCAEHRIVALDTRIDDSARSIYASLSSPVARRRLVASQTRWIARRHALCTRASNRYAGGTLAPVAYADCEVRLDRVRLAALAAIQGASSP